MPPLNRRTTQALLIAALASLILFAGWFASEVFEGETLAFDISVRDLIHSFASPPLTTIMIGVSIVGSPLVVAGVALAAFAVFLVSGYRRDALLLLAVGAGELLLNNSLKLAYYRERPEPFFGYPLPASFSFPSGHAFGSFCIFGLLGWLVSLRLERPLFVWAVRGFTAALIFLVGLSRVYLGVHYPTDVLAGYLVGAIWTLTVVQVAHQRSRKLQQ